MFCRIYKKSYQNGQWKLSFVPLSQLPKHRSLDSVSYDIDTYQFKWSEKEIYIGNLNDETSFLRDDKCSILQAVECEIDVRTRIFLDKFRNKILIYFNQWILRILIDNRLSKHFLLHKENQLFRFLIINCCAAVKRIAECKDPSEMRS